MHHLYAALRAHHLYHRDQHYVVQDGEVVIVDEFTGRLMTGRRWSDGLHQAVEAKEGVQIQAENQTLASITFQNYFRLYGKLAGMTGTADTEAYEFQEIYGLETVIIPPNQPERRARTSSTSSTRPTSEKYDAVIQDIRDCHERGQPVLVGTTVDRELRDHRRACSTKAEPAAPGARTPSSTRREADIVAQAGRPKMITIATNMAGRGTDIVLGGNVEKLIAGDRGRRVAGRSREGVATSSSCTPSGDTDHEFVEGRSAACASSPPSATSRAASTTSCAAVRAARATRVRRASTCAWKTR